MSSGGRFDFNSSPYAILMGSAESSGSASAFDIIDINAGYVRPVNPDEPSGFWVEPSRARIAGMIDINAIGQAVFFCEREGTDATTWTWRLRMRRGGNPNEVVTIVPHGTPGATVKRFDVWGAGDAPLVLNDPFSADFMTDPTIGSPDVNDVLTFDVQVIPGGAHPAVQTRFWGLLFPKMRPGNKEGGRPGGKGFAVGDRVR